MFVAPFRQSLVLSRSHCLPTKLGPTFLVYTSVTFQTLGGADIDTHVVRMGNLIVIACIPCGDDSETETVRLYNYIDRNKDGKLSPPPASSLTTCRFCRTLT